MGKHFNENLRDVNFRFRRALANRKKVESPVVPIVKAESTVPERTLYVKDSDKPLEVSERVESNG